MGGGRVSSGSSVSVSGGGRPLKQLVFHLRPLDVNARLAEQHDAVQQLQGDQPEEGDDCW